MGRIGQSCRVTEDGLVHHQWVEPRTAALTEARRAAVVLVVASRHLAMLTDYLAAVAGTKRKPTDWSRRPGRLWTDRSGRRLMSLVSSGRTSLRRRQGTFQMMSVQG